jgi:hypothetical protein
VLRQAHILQAEAQAEVDRIAPLADRARSLVADLTQCHSEAEAAIAAGDRAAAEKLVEALAAGNGALPLAPKSDSLETAAASVVGRLRIAREALTKLETEANAAGDRRERCRAGVARCACAVLTDQAAEIANEILADQARLDQQGEHQDLWGVRRRRG